MRRRRRRALHAERLVVERVSVQGGLSRRRARDQLAVRDAADGNVRLHVRPDVQLLVFVLERTVDVLRNAVHRSSHGIGARRRNVSTANATTNVHRTLPPGPPPRSASWLEAARYVWGFTTDPVGFVRSRFDRYGDVYFVDNPGRGLFVLRHPEHFHEVLVSRASAFGKAHDAFKQLGTVLGDGLLTSDGDDWKRQRRMVGPAFSPVRLVGYARAMTDESARTESRWIAGRTLDVGREMMELTLRIVGRTLFGEDVGGEVESVGRAMTAFQSSLVGVAARLPSWMPNPTRRASLEGIASLDRIVYGMIARARAAPKIDDEHPTLLQSLVSTVDVEGDGGTLDERQVRDQLVTLFLAGHETTSHALTWTLYLLSQNRDAERALFAKIDRVLDGRAASYDDLPSLPYVEQVVSEAMRLYPPVYSIARAAREDTTIGEFRVPKGSEIVLWPYFAQRDARWFERPDAFVPERFTEERAASIPRLAYMPFGGGPRACIGRSFAMLEARIALATILRRFRLELDPGQRVDVKPRITLMPKHGMKMIVRAR
jgi:cytochrome P450